MINNSMIDMICKVCGCSFIFKYKRKSHLENICSYSCLRKTGTVRRKFLLTALSNNGISYESDETDESLEIKYSNVMSKITKISTFKKHETLKEKFGNISLSYKKAGKKSKTTRVDNFLKNNNILPLRDANSLNEDDKMILFNKYYNSISKHGDKVSEGRLKAAGSEELKKQSYINAGIKVACNYFSIPIDTTYDMSEQEVKDITKRYYNAISFSNHDPVKWKATHLINEGIIQNNTLIDEVEISKLYSEYLSRRFSSNSLHCTTNGYKKTKKGWYEFVNISKSYFYRSSWEMIVLQCIDELIHDGYILDVFEPQRIKYYFDGKNRHYYPDIGIKLNNFQNIILEIKPASKTKDPMNLAKFDAANKVLEKSFIILTELEIFSDNIDNILIERIFIK